MIAYQMEHIMSYTATLAAPEIIVRYQREFA